MSTLPKSNEKIKEKCIHYLKEGFFSFGRDDLYISDNYTEGGCYSKFPNDYGDSNDSIIDLTGGSDEFSIVELEVLSELIL